MSLRESMNLTGRKAIITGGSRGLGLQIAEALGEMGAEMVLTARKQDELDEAVAHLAKLHRRSGCAGRGSRGRIGHCGGMGAAGLFEIV